MHTATRLAAPVIDASRRVESVGAHLRVRAVRAAERRVAALARRRRRARRRVRGGPGRGRVAGRLDPQHRGLGRSCRRVHCSRSCRRSTASCRGFTFSSPIASGLPPLIAIRDAADARRRAPAGRLHRGQPRLPASVPPLPGRAGLPRPVPRRAARRRAGRRRGAGRAPAPRHITFGDPDFFNGSDARDADRRALHAAHPDVTYDVTIKVEHLLQHRDLLPRAARHRLRVRDERRRIGRRSRARAARQGTHARAISSSRRAVPRKPA